MPSVADAFVPPSGRAARVAFLRVFLDHKPRLLALCRRWTGGRLVDAEDALSQVCIRALEELPEDGAISSYQGWLTRIAFNVCMDMHREKASRRRALERLTREVAEDGAEGVTSAEGEWLSRELGERIREAISGLPPRLGEPTRRRFVEEMPYERIARDLGLTNETVRKRIQEARSMLRASLGDRVGGKLPRGR